VSIMTARTAELRVASQASPSRSVSAMRPVPEADASTATLVVGPEDYTALMLALYHYPTRLASEPEAGPFVVRGDDLVMPRRR
jgi:hypothetical protein